MQTVQRPQDHGAVGEPSLATEAGNVSTGAGGEQRQQDQLHVIASSFRETFRTAEQLATSFMREAITRGIYQPGERLPQESIAAILGISRIPVRAGLRQLEEEGLITISPHRGATVTTLVADEIAEIYELRTVLECLLLELCIPRLIDADISRLRSIVERLEAAPSETDTLEQRLSFYEELYAIAARPRTLKLVMRLRGEVDRYLLARRVVEDAAGHFALLEAIEQRDTRAAKRWMRHHLAKVSQRLQIAVRDFDGEAAGEPADVAGVLRLKLRQR